MRKDNLCTFKTHTESLLRLLPQHCRLDSGEMAALFNWTTRGKIPEELGDNFEEKWLRLAFQQSRDVIFLADKWCHVSVDVLFSQKLDGLDDFALATYGTALLERDHECGNLTALGSSWSKICDVYNRIVDNPVGTVLLNYSWLYNDIVQLGMVDNAQRVRQLHHIALAFELRHGTDFGVSRWLLALAVHLMQTGCTGEGMEALARILESHVRCFDVYEVAANMLFDSGKNALGRLVLDAMDAISMNRGQRRRYEEQCRLYIREPSREFSLTQGEKRVAEAVGRAGCASNESCVSALASELVPHIDQVPVKQIDQ